MEEVLFKKGDTIIITDFGKLTAYSFSIGKPYVLGKDYLKGGGFYVVGDNNGKCNGWYTDTFSQGLKVELYKEALQDKKQRLERELKEVNAEIESNEPKIGDWCCFWDSNISKFIIDKHESENGYYYISLSGNMFLNCQKITDKDLLTKLNEIKL